MNIISLDNEYELNIKEVSIGKNERDSMISFFGEKEGHYHLTRISEFDKNYTNVNLLINNIHIGRFRVDENKE